MEPHSLLPIEALDANGADSDEQQDKDLIELLQMLDNTTPVVISRNPIPPFVDPRHTDGLFYGQGWRGV